MSLSSKSSVTSNLKPRSIFYVWYAELCRRSNISPLSIVKAPRPKNDTVLDFVADRIKPEEWTPILNALSTDTSLHVIAIRSRLAGSCFYHEINTEEKIRRMKRKCGSLWTDYILRSLTKSLGCCVKISAVLSCLELEGLPLSIEYLEILLSYLRSNRTIKILSLKHCPINDGGCQLVCTNLRLMPSISVINLSSCNLSSCSGEYIAKVIKHQQLNRYCESWHNSLRYEEPQSNAMGGIKRITINNNPQIGDEGAVPILDALDDDLWIKAIDMQLCGITENVSKRIINLVTQTTSLEVADFRNNENLSSGTLERILEEFQRRYKIGYEPEFFWGDNNSSVCGSSTYGSRSNLSAVSGFIQKARSAPIRNIISSEFSINRAFRRTKTLSNMEEKARFANFMNQDSLKELNDANRQLTELHKKLQQEILKRIETEKVNNELQKQIVGIRQLGNLHNDRFLTPEKISKVVRAIEDLNRNSKEGNLSKRPNGLHKTCSTLRNVQVEKPQQFLEKHKPTPKQEQSSKLPEKPKDLVISLRARSSKPAIKMHKTTSNRPRSNNPASVMSPILEVCTPSKPAEPVNAAQRLFERMILKQDYDKYIMNAKNQETSSEYCYDSDFKEEVETDDITPRKSKSEVQNGNLSSGSDSSLEMLYREVDAIDQDFSLNLSNGKKSVLIERTLDCESQYLRRPIHSTRIAPS